MSDNQNPVVPMPPENEPAAPAAQGGPIPPLPPNAPPLPPNTPPTPPTSQFGAPVPPSAPSASAPVPPSAPSASAPVPPVPPVPPSAPSAGMPTPPPAPHTTGAPASYGQPGPAYSQPAASGYPNYSQPQSPNYPPQPPTPAVPYPGQPAPTQPAGQALVPGQAPGYPVPAGQPAAAKTTIVMPAFDIKSEALALWQAVSAIFRSRPVETLKVAENSRWYVYLMALIAPLLSGLLLATLGSRTVGGVVSFGESLTGGAYKSGYSLPWGAWFSLLFTAFFVTIVLVALRALFIHFTFMVHGAKQPLMRSFQIVTAACAPMVFALGITWLLTLIPSAGLVVVVLVVAWLVLGWLQFVNEMVIYIGINRAARFQRSPVMIHATFSALWAIIAGVLIATMIVPSAEYLIPDIF